MMQHVSAAAPRFLLRMYVFERLLKSHMSFDKKSLSICEIGPGLGDIASMVLDKLDVQILHLFDSSPKARSILAKRFEGEPAVMINSDFRSENNIYDLALCFEVVEHIEDDLGFLGEIYSSLKLDGYLIGSVPAYQRKWQAVDELAGHYRRYSPNEMREALRKVGFSDITIGTYGFPLINLLYPLRQLYYSRQLKRLSDNSKSEATARSGVARGLCQSFNIPLVYSFCRVFDWLQPLTKTAPLDDGLVFICRKSR